MATAAGEVAAAMEIASVRPDDAIAKLRSVIFSASTSAEDLKVKELAIEKLSKLLASRADAPAMRTLLSELRPLFAVVPKAKTAKIVRNVIDALAVVSGFDALQIEMCKEQVAWAKEEKRTFLRHRVELRLAALFLDTKAYNDALEHIKSLSSEVKKLDDKLLLVDIHLLESRIHYALQDMPKSKAALTAARTNANAIYVPPSVQCAIDLQSGTLHADERDYKTAYSYFFEAFEQLNALNDDASAALKYMLLCKVMSGDASDVPAVASSKGGVKYAGEALDAMRAVALATTNRSLKDLNAALVNYASTLNDDHVASTHLSRLRHTLMEQNLARLIEPYSRVEIDHVAKLIELPRQEVENKLSQMILDGKCDGILDQANACLIVYDAAPPETLFKTTLETIANMEKVVDALIIKSNTLVAA